MALEVRLRQEVVNALKRFGKPFGTVIIETDTPCSIGLFHIKIRHLDDFIGYALYNKADTTKQPMENYVRVNNLSTADSDVLQSYYSLFLDFNTVYTFIEREWPFAINKLREFMGSKKEKNTKFLELLRVSNDENYKKACIGVKILLERFIGIEKSAKSLFHFFDQDMIYCLRSIIRNPFQVYYDTRRNDFSFCSEDYNGSYVINLKIGQPCSSTAYLFTGFKTERYILRKNRKMRCIYTNNCI